MEFQYDNRNKAENVFRIINLFLVWIFFLNAMYIPADTLFNMKKVSLVLLLLLNLRLYFSNRPNYSFRIIGYGFGLTLFSIVYSIALTGEIATNINSGYVGCILLLLPIAVYYNIDLEKIFVVTMKIMVVFIVVMGILHLVGIMNVYKNPILLWLYYTDNAKINPNAVTIIGFSIFLLASPVLVILLPYFIKNRNVVWTVFTACALFFSGTRANVLCGIACVVCCLILKKTGLVSKAFIVLVVLICLVAVITDGTLINYFHDWSENKVEGDVVRDETLTSIFSYWNDNPFSLVSGSGFSSTFYSEGRKEFVSNAELSYWILLRRVGIPLFIVFMSMFLYPVYRLMKDESQRLMAIGYLFYLIIAYTNPLLYGSTGMTVVLMMYYLCHIQDNKNNSLVYIDKISQKT